MAGPDIKSVMADIGSIAQVWAGIRADTQAILKKLEFASDTAAIALFKTRVQTATDLYKTLQLVLTDYKEDIDRSAFISQTLTVHAQARAARNL
ncbi:hypothetical protein K474DRAFT_1667924 [Panus rudis PR-1116 ss-1]|nr:hypothetical protein K474DRAFT_1667924 [Panus rudis PR-1116 ss-1]